MSFEFENALWYGFVGVVLATMLLMIWRNVPMAGAKWWTVSLSALFLHRLLFPSDAIPWAVNIGSLACLFMGLWVMYRALP